MLGALAAATLIVAASLTVGQAALTVCGRRDDRAVAGPVGLALLLAASAIVAGLGGRGAAIAVALGVITGLGVAVLVRRGLPHVPAATRWAAIAAALLAGLAAAIPFIAAGTIGILGVGLVNDDMASHLLLADWIAERFRPEPVLVDQGYPLGPHGLVAGLGALLGARSIDVFAGLVLAVPALTAFVAAGALASLRPRVAVPSAALVALPYLAAAYLAQEAFKEPILALFVLAFALVLAGTRSPLDAVPLGLLAAGAVYVYSFPGLAWLAGTAVIWAGVRWLGEGRAGTRRSRSRIHASHRPRIHAAEAPSSPSPTLLTIGAAVLTLLVVSIPELGRLVDFTDFRALDPDRANEGGLGNLRGHISPLEAFGVWPTSEFRLAAGAGSLPAIAFYAGAVVAAGAFAVALPRWLRRFGPAVPAALAAAVLIYLAARAFGTVYSSGKALAIAAPLITLITLGGLLSKPEEQGDRSGEEGAGKGRERLAKRLFAALPRPLPALTALVVGLAAAFSSFLVLRQAPVAPETHMDELAQFRPVVAGRDVLFLGRDNFILYELRGSKPYTHVRNFYDPYFVEPNFGLRDVGSKFDFDSVSSDTLGRFRYVITTRASYGSGPPPGYRPLGETDSYLLWERARRPVQRAPVERGPEPGARQRCADPSSPAIGSAAAIWPRPPVRADEGDWRPAATIESGESASVELDLPPGRWQLSLQYDATRPVRVSGPGFGHELPANLDYRGVGPFWPAGTLDVAAPGPTLITAAVDEPPDAGRLLGADSVAHLAAIAATPAGRGYVSDATPPYPGDAGSIFRGPEACGEYADWVGR